MSWGKLDDRFHENRKVRRAWKNDRPSVGLHVMAIAYCAGHETDGFVDTEFVEEKIPSERERTKAIDALIDAGLWTAENGGWRITNYLEFNPSRAELEAKRQKDSERKARGRDAQSAARPSGLRADSGRSPSGLRAVSSGPDPTRPLLPPKPPASGGRKRDVKRFEDDIRSFAIAVFGTACTEDHVQAVRGAWNQGARDKHAVMAWIGQWRPDLGGAA